MTLLLTRMSVEPRDEAPSAHPSETHLSANKHLPVTPGKSGVPRLDPSSVAGYCGGRTAWFMLVLRRYFAKPTPP